MERSGLDIGDYVDVLRRRKAQLLIPMLAVFAIAVAIAFGLPPVYRSTATILIEQQDIPQDLVRSTVTSYAAERIQTISQRVMTRENLWSIVEKYDLFPEERRSGNIDIILPHIRQNIEVEMVSADIVDPRSGRQSKATIAFDLSFYYSEATAAKEVVDELVSLYLEENIRIREQMASETSSFLSEEASRLSAHITELEAVLASFKEKNVGQMPELMTLNMNLIERTERELEDTRREISSLEERKVFLESQLAQLEPNTGDSPEGRLRSLQMQLLRASSIYAPDHPDIVNLRREIEVLKAQTGSGTNRKGIEAQILQLQSELASARQKYSDDHPDIIALKKSLANLNDELRNSTSGGLISTDGFQPDNPAYVATKTQLEAIKIGLRTAQEKTDRLKAKLAEYEDRIVQMPRVEQEGVAMRREYDNAVQKYHEIKQKLLEAQVSEQLEKDQKGERFSLIDPPIIPSEPYQPNRIGILLLGTVLAMVIGLGVASVAEYMDQTVRGSRGVSVLLGSPPIATIPYFKADGEEGHPQRRMLLVGMIILTVLILGVLAIKALFMSADNL